MQRVSRFAKVAGPLRLAKKYQMTKLATQLTSILEADWPSKLDDWMRIREAVEARGFEPVREQNDYDEGYVSLWLEVILPDPGA